MSTSLFSVGATGSANACFILAADAAPPQLALDESSLSLYALSVSETSDGADSDSEYVYDECDEELSE